MREWCHPHQRWEAAMRVDHKHTAYHEAGHAVIGLKLGYKVEKVTIRPRYSKFGCTFIEAGPDNLNLLDEETANIKSNLAGLLAEQLVSPYSFNELIEHSSWGDWRRVRRSARLIGDSLWEAEALIVRCA